MAIHEIANVEYAAHGKAMAGDTRVPEGKVGGVVASEAATGYGDAIMASVLADARVKLFHQQPVVQGMLPCSFSGRYSLIVPAFGIDAVRAVDLYFSIFEKPSGCLDEPLIFVLVIAALGGRKEDYGIACMPEYEHLKVSAKRGGMPFMIFFPQVHINYTCTYVTGKPNLTKKRQIPIMNYI